MPVSGGTIVWPQKKSSFQWTAAQTQRMSKVSLDFSASSLARISACIYFLVRNPETLTFVPSALKRSQLIQISVLNFFFKGKIELKASRPE